MRILFLLAGVLVAESAWSHDNPDQVCLSDGQHLHAPLVERTAGYDEYALATGWLRVALDDLRADCGTSHNDWEISAGLRTIVFKDLQELLAIPEPAGSMTSLTLLDGQQVYVLPTTVAHVLAPPGPEERPDLAKFYRLHENSDFIAERRYYGQQRVKTVGTVIGVVAGTTVVVGVVGLTWFVFSYGCC